MIGGERVRQAIARYGQRALNIYLFLSFGAWCLWSTWQTWTQGRLDALELSFVVPNVILVGLFLLRKPHREISTSLLDQGISLVAFCSGIPIIGSSLTGGPTAAALSWGIIIAANLLGIATLLNLGRSFGILIAFRELRDSGLYGIIRHPMYLSDILLRVGYVVSHTDPFSVTVVVGSTGCYVYRALLEERFLARQPEYAEYMTRVRYRFIPWVF